MGNSTIWNQTKAWCRTHPEKKAAIVTPKGSYVIVFIPHKEAKDLNDGSWITKEFTTDKQDA